MSSFRFSVALLVLVGGGCGSVGRWHARSCWAAEQLVAPPRGLAGGRTRNIVLVTLDGVRWQEIVDGVEAARARADGLAACDLLDAPALLPHLRALARVGVEVGGLGGEVVASGPNFVSLPGYREILTGRSARRCTSNFCGPMDERTILDELREQEGLAPEQIAVIASWERLARAAALDEQHITLSAGRHAGAGRDRLRVSARASALLDEAAQAGAYPGYFDYRPDRYTAPLALEYLVARRPRFLHVALGDTDERAHRRDYAGYLEALRYADQFLGDLWRTLQTMDEYGAETTVIVTTDHGRARDFSGHGGGAPESGRVWLIAAGGAIGPGAAEGAARTVRLADIAPTVRVLLGLRADPSARAGEPIDELLPRTLQRGPVLARYFTTRDLPNSSSSIAPSAISPAPAAIGASSARVK